MFIVLRIRWSLLVNGRVYGIRIISFGFFINMHGWKTASHSVAQKSIIQFAWSHLNASENSYLFHR